MIPSSTPRHGGDALRRVLWAAILAAWTWTATAAGAADMALTQVVAVEGTEVVLGAGHQDGLDVSAPVTLLREGEPIIHPLTGEVLGVPQEPVGTLVVRQASEHSARGSLEKTYSEPRVGDLAEYRPQAPRPLAPAPEVAKVLRQVEALRQDVEQVRERDEDLRTYPDFARRVGDQIVAMRSYLNGIDRRLAAIEERQSDDSLRLSSMLRGEQPRDDHKEFTIRYAPDTQVRLQVAGKTLTIDVVADTLTMAGPRETAAPAVMAAPARALGGILDMFRTAPAPMAMEDLTAGAQPWYVSPYHLAAGVGVLLAMLITVFIVIRRRYSQVMDGLEDFDEDYEGYLEDEDEDEDDDDDRK